MNVNCVQILLLDHSRERKISCLVHQPTSVPFSCFWKLLLEDKLKYLIQIDKIQRREIAGTAQIGKR